jgi:hypothetical protein
MIRQRDAVSIRRHTGDRQQALDNISAVKIVLNCGAGVTRKKASFSLALKLVSRQSQSLFST